MDGIITRPPAPIVIAPLDDNRLSPIPPTYTKELNNQTLYAQQYSNFLLNRPPIRIDPVIPEQRCSPISHGHLEQPYQGLSKHKDYKSPGISNDTYAHYDIHNHIHSRQQSSPVYPSHIIGSASNSIPTYNSPEVIRQTNSIPPYMYSPGQPNMCPAPPRYHLPHGMASVGDLPYPYSQHSMTVNHDYAQRFQYGYRLPHQQSLYEARSSPPTSNEYSRYLQSLRPMLNTPSPSDYQHIRHAIVTNTQRTEDNSALHNKFNLLPQLHYQRPSDRMGPPPLIRSPAASGQLLASKKTQPLDTRVLPTLNKMPNYVQNNPIPIDNNNQTKPQVINRNNMLSPSSNIQPTKPPINYNLQISNMLNSEIRYNKTRVLPNDSRQKVNSGTNIAVKWTEIQAVKVPYITRANNNHYISVRVAEIKLLSEFPNTYPEEIKKQPPLKSIPLTPSEVNIMDAFNRENNYAFGIESFQNDLVVELNEFKLFYLNLQTCFKEKTSKLCKSTISPTRQVSTNNNFSTIKEKPTSKKSPTGSVQVTPHNTRNNIMQVKGGWMQINNTVLPYIVKRNKERYVPLCIIKYAAGVNVQESDFNTLPNEIECTYLNKICNSAGLHFSFERDTVIASISSIIKVSDKMLILKDLPNENPFSFATYDPVFESNKPVDEQYSNKSKVIPGKKKEPNKQGSKTENDVINLDSPNDNFKKYKANVSPDYAHHKQNSSRQKASAHVKPCKILDPESSFSLPHHQNEKLTMVNKLLKHNKVTSSIGADTNTRNMCSELTDVGTIFSETRDRCTNVFKLLNEKATGSSVLREKGVYDCTKNGVVPTSVYYKPPLFAGKV